MFNSEPSAPSRSWHTDVLLHPQKKNATYADDDWLRVPTIDYRTTRFRQMSAPESARVFDDSDGFVLETFGAAPAPEPVPAVVTATQDPIASDAAFAQDTALGEDVQEQPLASEVDARLADVDAGQAGDEAASAQDAPEDVQAAEAGNAGLQSEQDAAGIEDDTHEAPTADASESVRAVAPAVDEAMLAHIREQAFAQGREEGYQSGWSEGHAAATNELQAQLEADKNEALLAQQQSLMAQTEADKALLIEVGARVQALCENPHQFFEPLKRLAVHIAEQLVLAELNVSGQAIERLVQRCLDELDLHTKGLVTVELNPQDKARLEEMGEDMLQGMTLVAFPGLQPGSVRVIANETQIEDLIQNRLQAMAHRLLGQPESWREKSPFFRQPLAQRDTEVQDLSARPRALDIPPMQEQDDA